MSYFFVRRRAWEIFESAKTEDRVSHYVDVFLVALILLNGVSVVLESMQSLAVYYDFFIYFEWFSIVIFTIEYLLRLWSCVHNPAFAKPIRGRLRYMSTPLALIDLMAILPAYLTFLPMDLRMLRLLRGVRIFRLAKLTRYSSALRLLMHVFYRKREEFFVTTSMMVVLLIIGSTLMYFAEHEAQPEAFPNIPRAMWWGVVTLTTVGYGDLVPVTTAGRFLAAILSILGIGLFALPTGIIGSGLVEVMSNPGKHEHCPHCGMELDLTGFDAEASQPLKES